MSRIKRLNDKQTIAKNQPKPSFTVWKGEKTQDTKPGQNLNTKYRIEAPHHLKSKIKKLCNAEEKNGSLYVDELAIIPAYEDEYKTFDSRMAAYTASRAVLLCDGETINTEFVETKSPTGGVYFKPIKVNKPCPVAEDNFDCPKGCKRTGDFFFYIYELVLDGCSEFGRLRVRGLKDNQSIAAILDETKAEIGSIKNSPFVSEKTRTYIVYHLTRKKSSHKYPILDRNKQRTSKRGTKDDWIVNLQLHPMWNTTYQYYLQANQLKALNYQPSMKLIQQVHGELIQPSPLAPAIAPAFSLEEYKKELAAAYSQNNWEKQGWVAMMNESFGTTEVNQEINLELLMAIAKSSEERDRWCF